MISVYIQTLDEIIPNTTSQMILTEVMKKPLPNDREEIEQHLSAFAFALIRYSRVELDTEALWQYFLKECGWDEFQAIWYRSRIEEALVIAKTNKRLGTHSE